MSKRTQGVSSKEYKEEMVMKFKIPMMSIWYLCRLHSGDALSIRIENYVHVCSFKLTSLYMLIQLKEEKKEEEAQHTYKCRDYI